MKPEYRNGDPVAAADGVQENMVSLFVATPFPSDRSWTIGELARECDVTLRALRFYEGKGLLAPAREGSVRLYGPDDVRRLKLILRGKRIGFSLIEIRELLSLLDRPHGGQGAVGALLERVERQVAVLDEQRREVELSLEAIRHEIDGLRRHLAG